MTIITKKAKETRELGKKMAATLKGGEVLVLSGDLGAGKTVFIKGLAQGLGIKKIITSPTFVIMKVYPVNKKGIKYLAHLDCYRVGDPDSILAIGAPEYFGRQDSVAVIEWAEKIKPLWPKRQLIRINFEIKPKDVRRISIN